MPHQLNARRDEIAIEKAGDDEEKATAATPGADLKKCPFCAETIRREAVLCRFCKSAVPITDATPATSHDEPKVESSGSVREVIRLFLPGPESTLAARIMFGVVCTCAATVGLLVVIGVVASIFTSPSASNRANNLPQVVQQPLTPEMKNEPSSPFKSEKGRAFEKVVAKLEQRPDPLDGRDVMTKYQKELDQLLDAFQKTPFDVSGAIEAGQKRAFDRARAPSPDRAHGSKILEKILTRRDNSLEIAGSKMVLLLFLGVAMSARPAELPTGNWGMKEAELPTATRMVLLALQGEPPWAGCMPAQYGLLFSVR